MAVLTESRSLPGIQPLRAVRPWTIALAFGLLGAVVSAAGSWIPSLWGDEAATLLSAKRPVASLFGMLGHVDAVHGTYYLFMHGWIRLAGESPFALRLPSAIAVGAAVAAVTLIAGRRGGPTAAIAAGVVACVLPRLTYAGEEARSYALTAAAAAWLTLLLLWLVDGGGRTAHTRARRAAWLLYAVGMAASTYLFLYSATMLVAHAAIVAAARVPRRVWRAWWLAAVCAIVAALPLVLVAFFERAQIRYLRTGGDDKTQYYYLLWFGAPYVAIVAWPLILVALGRAVAIWRRGRTAFLLDADARRARGQRPLTTTTVAAAWLFLPLAALLIVDAAFPMYTARYSTFAAPAAALLMSEGLLITGRYLARRDGRRALVATGLGALVVVATCTPAYLSQRGPYAKNDSDWAEVSAAVGAVAHPGDAVVFDESARPSRRPRLAMRTYPAGFAGLKDVTLSVPYSDNRGWADRAYTVAQADERGRFAGITRVWLLEYDFQGVQHTYGMAGLERMGFKQTGERVRTHRTLIVELAR